VRKIIIIKREREGIVTHLQIIYLYTWKKLKKKKRKQIRGRIDIIVHSIIYIMYLYL
jgi:hypothetical protein